MKRFPRVDNITPDQFEKLVKAWIGSVAGSLDMFTAAHLESIDGLDGEYCFDVTARFRLLNGANFLIVIECKKHKNPIKREIVQVLRDKQISVGAHKAMVVATADFQSGAIEYAGKHGIALVQIVNGAAVYIQASAVKRPVPIPDEAEDYAGFFYGPNPTGSLLYPQPFTAQRNYGLAEYLKENHSVAK